MKVRLVVGQGPHKGKEISVSTSSKFIIGRSSECQLRPASQAISKKHCALEVRDGKCYVEDLGSTNGTFVNNEQLQGEREVHDGDSLKVGPLDFIVKIVATPAVAPSTDTPMPMEKLPVKAPAPAAKKPAPAPAPAAKTGDEPVDEEDVAALLLDLDAKPSRPAPKPSEEEDEVPSGSTIMDILIPQKESGGVPAPYRPQSAGKQNTPASTSNAAKEILEKYRRRPRS